MRDKELSAPESVVGQSDDHGAETGLINAFGMYWRRDKVAWKTTPKILGAQSGGTSVDFGAQIGIYLLYDGARAVYVGRATARPLGARLREHTADRLDGRWDRFSWFGVRQVSETGDLQALPASVYTTDVLIVTMEALLIEGLEPPRTVKAATISGPLSSCRSRTPTCRRPLRCESSMRD